VISIGIVSEYRAAFDAPHHGGKHLEFGAAALQAEQSVGCQQPTRRSLRLCVSRRAIDNPRIDSLF